MSVQIKDFLFLQNFLIYRRWRLDNRGSCISHRYSPVSCNARKRATLARRAIIYHQTDHAWNNIQRASLARAISGNNSCPDICIIYSRRCEDSLHTNVYVSDTFSTDARPFHSLRDAFKRSHRCKSLSAWAKFRSSSKKRLGRIYRGSRVKMNHWNARSPKFDNSCDWRGCLEVSNFRKLDSDVYRWIVKVISRRF